MADLLTAPSPGRTKRWTVTEYDRLAALDFLPGRYELIDGEIIEKMPPNPPHIWSLMLLQEWLVSVFGFRFVRVEAPLQLPDDYYRPEPDLAVTKEPGSVYQRRLATAEECLMVAEVCDTSLASDLTTKALVYARAGIPEYWALDIEGRRLVAHRSPTSVGYQDVQTLGEEATVSPLARPEATVKVTDLLPSKQ